VGLVDWQIVVGLKNAEWVTDEKTRRHLDMSKVRDFSGLVVEGNSVRVRRGRFGVMLLALRVGHDMPVGLLLVEQTWMR
jgi:hypothetical protein